ncbi:MAG: MarC family protein [Bacteroidales bacterium]|nr:MarC family protein [Bacteroidales bacterium]
MDINSLEILSSFIVLFAVIDILGSLPIVISMQEKGIDISPAKTTIIAFIILVAFMYLGEALLSLFGVDINSFAVAGAFVLFIIGLEMVCGLEIFKQDSPGTTDAIVPLAFPLLAGPGTFTSLLSMRAEYAAINIVIALILNMIVVYLMLRSTAIISKVMGSGGLYVIKKFFGIIVLAIAIKLFTSNLTSLIEQFSN